MSTNCVFVLDTDRRPLSPCHPARARALLKQGKAAVLRRFPFTVILKRSVPDAQPKPCQVKLDPGSRITGIAIVQDSRVIWAAEIIHRGCMIKKKLADRSARRRNRRTRLRYRKPSYRTRAQIRNAKATYKPGDIAKCGNVVGRISPRTSGRFEITPLTGSKPFSRPMRLFMPVHRVDGYSYDPKKRTEK